MKNFEHKFADCKKDKNGYTKIRIRLYDNAEYICVMAKPVPLTDPDVKKVIDRIGADEAKRINFTVFTLKNVPGTEKLYGKIDGDWFMYFNGAECAWKFYEEVLAIDDEDLTDEQIQQLADEKPWFEPHNDEAGNYGDWSVHAVYDLADLKNPRKIKKSGNSKKISNYDKLLALALDLKEVACNLAVDIIQASKNHKALLFKSKNVKKLRETFDQIVCDTDADEAI